MHLSEHLFSVHEDIYTLCMHVHVKSSTCTCACTYICTYKGSSCKLSIHHMVMYVRTYVHMYIEKWTYTYVRTYVNTVYAFVRIHCIGEKIEESFGRNVPLVDEKE